DARAKTVSINRPCAAVVSAQLYLSDLKAAPFSAIDRRRLRRSRVDPAAPAAGAWIASVSSPSDASSRGDRNAGRKADRAVSAGDVVNPGDADDVTTAHD